MPVNKRGAFQAWPALSIKREGMNDAQRLARALNALVRGPQFSNMKARAGARQEPAVNWAATKALNADFNPDVDGFESFVMNDSSMCHWSPGQFHYTAEPARR